MIHIAYFLVPIFVLLAYLIGSCFYISFRTPAIRADHSVDSTVDDEQMSELLRDPDEDSFVYVGRDFTQDRFRIGGSIGHSSHDWD